MKHTPTPWKSERPSRIMLDAGIQRYAIYKGTELKPEWIAEIHFAKHDTINDGKEQNEANIRLIITAVNNHQKLVDALKAYAELERENHGMMPVFMRPVTQQITEVLKSLE